MTRRCAIYARYSSDLQREASIEDQVRRCREYAGRQGWTVVEQFVVADKAVSAAALAGRDGLQRLVSAAKLKSRIFDCLLIDDTSRLARDMSDALRTFKTLEFHGVTVVSCQPGDRLLAGKHPATSRHARYHGRAVLDRPRQEGSSRPGGSGIKGLYDRRARLWV